MASSRCASFSTTSFCGAVNPCLRIRATRDACFHPLSKTCPPVLSVRSEAAYRIPVATFCVNSSDALQRSYSSRLCNGVGWKKLMPGKVEVPGGAARTQKSGRTGGVVRAQSNEGIISLSIAVGVPLIAGIISSLVNSPNTPWFRNLKKPSYNPPDWLFGLAWGILYPVMGLSSWLVWTEGGFRKQSAPLTAYIVQLVLNLVWPALFFKAHKLKLSLIDISALLVAIVTTYVLFKPVNPFAANLLIPYIAWVAFATFLNYKYMQYNSDKGEPIVPPITA